MDGTVGVGGGFGVVRDHQDGLAEALVKVAQQVQDDIGVLAVEIARRLVGEQNSRAVDDGASDGDTLLFAPRERARGL